MALPLTAALLTALILSADPLSLFSPALRLSPAERRTLDEGRTVARTLESPGRQVGVFAISRIGVPANALIEHAREIESLKRSNYVMAVRRFSNPPRIEDLDELVLTPRDVQAAIACRVGNCSFKLTAPEIAMLQGAAAGDGDREARYLRAFREVVLARVEAYRAGGLRGLPPVVNRKNSFCLEQVFVEIVEAMPLSRDTACADGWLRDDPSSEVESFLYWSYETYGAGKPVVSVTHVGLIPARAAGDAAIVLGKQIFASRYLTGGLSLTVVTGQPEEGGSNYLIYVNRSGVDLLDGLFGSIKRAMLESRLKRDVPGIIAKLRTRLERSRHH